MPNFSTMSVQEALRLTGGGKRQKDLAAYLESINSLDRGSAGVVEPSQGESLSTVRRRLGDAARLSGREIEIRRGEGAVYFWIKDGRRRSGPRPRKA